MNGYNSHVGSLRPRERTKTKKTGRFRPGKQAQAHSLKEQPVADRSSTVPCRVCGVAVDQRRLDAHMIRFHGGSAA